jgi:NADH-quinone oxidoreductase subunit C/D
MENIKQIILKTVPAAVIEERAMLTVKVAPKELHTLVKTLNDSGFDYLVSLIGADWGEELGAIYILSSSTDVSQQIEIKTGTADRKNPLLYSVTDLYETAHLNEREIYAMYGIRFINNPDMRKFLLNEDWLGFPFRKDYDATPILNPMSIESREMSDTTHFVKEDKNGNLIEGKAEIFGKDDYVINIGPQHPSTHGVMHFRTSLDGEIIRHIDVHSGYIHRGIEKLSESMTYPQIQHFTDRLDYLSANINRHALCMCVEKALELEVPQRAQYIRTITDELQRISSHLLAWACQTNDLGATTAFIYGMREREDVLKIFEKLCGGRLIINNNVIGGTMFDIYPDFQKDVKAFIPKMRKMLKEYDAFFSHNVIALGRMINIGVMSKQDAVSYGVSGVSGRASGWSCDIRKYVPYALYDKVEFKEVIRTEGDSYARYLNRLDEIEQSLHIIEQLIDGIPEGDYCAKTKAIIKLPEGEFTQRVETSKGDFLVYIDSRGEKTPYRIKFRSPSMALVSIMPLICKEQKISDFIGIGGSMHYIIPDIDR